MVQDQMSPRIALIGGGVSGVILAIALHKRGITVDIYEQAAKFGELGAGIAFTPNAIQAMNACSPDIEAARGKVATHNTSKKKKKVWLDWVDGYHSYHDEHGYEKELWCFQIRNDEGLIAVHRAAFLDELVKLLPRNVSHLGKRLVDFSEQPDGSLKLSFDDDTAAIADAIIGCDGIKSSVRRLMFGATHPSSSPAYTNKYAYRGLVPMEVGVELLGEELAGNSHLYMGQDGHMLTFPVAHGKLMNIVAFKTNIDPWPDFSKYTIPTQKSDVLADFVDFGPVCKKILNLLNDKLDCWGIFDMGDHPLPYYNKGCVCLIGDAAHATSPHQGAGAGFCVEDAAVMAELLLLVLKEGGNVKENLERAFNTFDAVRRERTQWLVQSSRIVGDLYEWRIEGIGNDVTAIEKDLRRRCEIVWGVDIETMLEEARENYRQSGNN